MVGHDPLWLVIFYSPVDLSIKLYVLKPRSTALSDYNFLFRASVECFLKDLDMHCISHLLSAAPLTAPELTFN